MNAYFESSPVDGLDATVPITATDSLTIRGVKEPKETQNSNVVSLPPDRLSEQVAPAASRPSASGAQRAVEQPVSGYPGGEPPWMENLKNIGSEADISHVESAISKIFGQKLVDYMTKSSLPPGNLQPVIQYRSEVERDESLNGDQITNAFLRGNFIYFRHSSGAAVGRDFSAEVARELGWIADDHALEQDRSVQASSSPVSLDQSAIREPLRDRELPAHSSDHEVELADDIRPSDEFLLAQGVIHGDWPLHDDDVSEASFAGVPRAPTPREIAFERRQAEARQLEPPVGPTMGIPWDERGEEPTSDELKIGLLLANSLREPFNKKLNYAPASFKGSGSAPYEEITDPVNRLIALGSGYTNPIWGSESKLEKHGLIPRDGEEPTPFVWRNPRGFTKIIDVYNIEQCDGDAPSISPQYSLTDQDRTKSYLSDADFAIEMGMNSNEMSPRRLEAVLGNVCRSHPMEFVNRVNGYLRQD